VKLTRRKTPPSTILNYEQNLWEKLDMYRESKDATTPGKMKSSIAVGDIIGFNDMYFNIASQGEARF
jgi:hypothetical protein